MNTIPRVASIAAEAIINRMAWDVVYSCRPLADRLNIAADLIGAGHRARDVDRHLDNVMSRARELRRIARGEP